jgi:hypothetical protein
VEIAGQVYPSIELQRLRQIGHLIGMLTEGGTVLFAGPGERSVAFDDVRTMAVDMVMNLLESAAAEARGARKAVRAAHSRRLAPN